MALKIQKLHLDAIVPAYATKGSAGLDLASLEDAEISGHSVTKVRTGLAFVIPEGYVGLVSLRSGTSVKTKLQIVNAPSIIDADYRGEILVPCRLRGESFWLHADKQGHSFYYHTLKKGERFAQMTIVPVAYFNQIEVVDKLDETERGTGGFGSSGTGV